MNFNFIVPQSPAGAIPALYCIPPNVTKSHTTSFSFLHPKFKTEMCNKYDPVLGCPYGEQCQFRHPEDPAPAHPNGGKTDSMPVGRNGGRFINRPPNINTDFRRRIPSFGSQYANGRQVRSPTTPISFLHPKFKTEMCNKYDTMYGCPYGEQCQFRHPEDSLPPSQIILKKFSQITITEGGPTNGDVGSNAHPFSLPMAGRGGDRFFGRSSVAGDFRRRNPSYNSQQPFNKGKFQHQNNKINNAQKPDNNKMTTENPDFLVGTFYAHSTLRGVRAIGKSRNNGVLPAFLTLAGKSPKNGMRRYNSHETLGHFTYGRVSALKKRLSPAVIYSPFKKI